MNHAAIRDIAARWEEYGPLNTARGRLVRGDRTCAIGDIAKTDLRIPTHLLAQADARGGNFTILRPRMRRTAAALDLRDNLFEMFEVEERTTNVYEEVGRYLRVGTRTIKLIANLNDYSGERPTKLLEVLARDGEEAAIRWGRRELELLATGRSSKPAGPVEPLLVAPLWPTTKPGEGKILVSLKADIPEALKVPVAF